MTLRARALWQVGGLLAVLLGVGPVAYGASSLPNGASSLNEVYQDWTVFCRVPQAGEAAAKVQCEAMAMAMDDRSHKRLFSVQLEADGDQERGVAVVPFGLDLTRGLTIANASQPVGDTYSFSTCLPKGCLVPLSFDDRQWADLLKEDTVTLSLMSLSGQSMQFHLSIKGLAQAMQRVRMLSR